MTALARKCYKYLTKYVKYIDGADDDHIFKIVTGAYFAPMWDDLETIEPDNPLFDIINDFNDYNPGTSDLFTKILNWRKLPVTFLCLPDLGLINRIDLKCLVEYDRKDRDILYNNEYYNKQYLLLYSILNKDIELFKFMINDGAYKLVDDITIYNIKDYHKIVYGYSISDTSKWILRTHDDTSYLAQFESAVNTYRMI